MNGMTMGMNTTASVCGMCIAIRGSPPSSVNPAENQGVVGEYYAYVYEVGRLAENATQRQFSVNGYDQTCDDCTQSAGIQLGIPGHGQSTVVWRAIPCPSAQTETPFIFFNGAKQAKARFQVC
uniref:Uncharacterized protein n=1 Tax=Spongospora subterranea TaxID=70186 RepID=A0A0H5RD66_9EUKA|eukprot:CRZ11542.1 hypothetical protein [Spongospora subterranea]